MDRSIVYIAELDQDIDDVVAAEWLHKNGVLKAVVCDPSPKTKDGYERKKQLESLGIQVKYSIPSGAQTIFVGGALTSLSSYIKTHKIDLLVMNGGFVGCNIVNKGLNKFKDKKHIRTFNFDLDVKATDNVLKSNNINRIVLVGKNVCHSIKNTRKGIWGSADDITKEVLEKYNVKEEKRLHDLLACREGLIHSGIKDWQSWLNYEKVYVYNTGLKGNMTEWGSTFEKTEYKQVEAATEFKRG